MNSKTIGLALLINITLISCVPAVQLIQATQTPQRSSEIEEAAIYELLLQDECRNTYHGTPVFIVNETISDVSFDEDSVFWVEPSLDKETFSQYVEINQVTQEFSPDLSRHKYCKIITSDELSALTQQDPSWYNAHMVISFSRVGFNSNLDQALVYREYDCGGECAGGDLYFLIRRADNSWFIRETVGGWNS